MPETQRDDADAPARPAAPTIDLAALAERVYRLMLEDLRLERARAGSLSRRDEVRR